MTRSDGPLQNKGRYKHMTGEEFRKHCNDTLERLKNGYRISPWHINPEAQWVKEENPKVLNRCLRCLDSLNKNGECSSRFCIRPGRTILSPLHAAEPKVPIEEQTEIYWSF